MFAHTLAVRGVHLPPDGDDHVANHTNDVVYRAVLVAETFEEKVRSRGCLAGDWVVMQHKRRKVGGGVGEVGGAVLMYSAGLEIGKD